MDSSIIITHKARVETTVGIKHVDASSVGARVYNIHSNEIALQIRSFGPTNDAKNGVEKFCISTVTLSRTNAMQLVEFLNRAIQEADY